MKAYRNALYGMILVLVLILSGCSDNILPAALESIAVTPATLSLTAGDTSPALAVEATFADTSTADVAAADVTWSTSASAVATVSKGVVTAVAPGSATITATYQEKTATVAVTVTAADTQATLESIAADPATITIEVGQDSVAIAVTASYDDDSTETIPAADVTWSSSAEGTATVAAGVVTGVAEGTATITATYDGKTATTAVTVVAAVDTGIIPNGSFTQGLTDSWELWSEAGNTTASVVDGEAEIIIPATGNAWWGVQFWQEGISVPEAGDYTLSFDARASVVRDMRIEIAPTEVAASPTNLDFLLGTEMTTYEATVNLSGLGATPTLKLNIGLGNVSSNSQAATVYLDNISLKPQESALTTYSLSVTVDDGTDPIEGATVKLNTNMEATTDASGVATFTVEPRQYPVSVSMSGYVGFSSVTQVSADTNVPATLTVAAPTEDAYLYGTTETVDVTNTLAHWDSGSAFNASYADDPTYNPVIEVTTSSNLWGSGTPGFALAFTQYSTGAAVGYDNLKFKLKSTELTDVAVKFPGATTEEISYAIADYGVDLGNGWTEITVPLSGYGDLGSNTEVGILRFQAGLTETAIYITDVYFDVAQ